MMIAMMMVQVNLIEDSPMQIEKDLTSQVGNNVEVTSDGSLVNRRSERVRQAKKVKEVTSLYN